MIKPKCPENALKFLGMDGKDAIKKQLKSVMVLPPIFSERFRKSSIWAAQPLNTKHSSIESILCPESPTIEKSLDFFQNSQSFHGEKSLCNPTTRNASFPFINF